MKQWWSDLIGGKQVNGRALLILLAGVVVFGGGVYFLHGFQVRRNARGLFEQAKVAQASGDKEQAARYLEQHLGLDPSNTEALAELGLLLHDLANNPRARLRVFFMLDQVLRRDAGRDDIRRRSARLATQIGRYSDGKHHLEVLRKSAGEGDVELLQLSARCEAGLRAYDKAAELYRQAMAKAPQQIDISLEYAALLREHLNLPEFGEVVIEQMVQRDRRSAKTRLEAARYFVRFGVAEKAWPHLRFILDELGQPDGEVLVLAGDVALSRGEIDEARKLFEQGKQLFPDDDRMNRGLAQVEVRRGGSTKALAFLERTLRELPKEPVELWTLANLLIDAGAVEQAEAVVMRLGKTGAPGLVSYLEARMLMRKSRWGEAANLLERARGDQQFSSQLAKHANLLLAECSDHLLNPDQKLEALRRALEVDPNWLPAARAMALALAQAGKLDLAISEARKLVRQSPLAKEDLARLLVDRNLRLPAPQRDWSEITRLIGELPTSLREGAGVKLFQAEVLALQGKPDEARKEVEAQRDADPKQVAPWLFLTALAEPRGAAAALEVLDEAEKHVGKRVDWQLARARLWLKRDGPGAKKHLSQLLEGVDALPSKDRDRLLRGLAEAFAGVGDITEAMRLWSQVAEHNLDELGVRFRLFEAALQGRDFDQAQRLLTQIKRIEARDGPLTACAEGSLRLAQAEAGNKQKVAEARSFLARAGSMRPSWARPPLLEAAAYDLEGQEDKALEKYRAALDRGEGRLRVVQRALELMQKQGLHVEANALLRKLPEQALAAPGLGRLAGQVTLLSAAAEGQDPETARQQALELARKTAANSKDHRDHLWFGQLALLMGKTAEAEKALRRACELEDTALESWTALVFLLARTDPKKAEAELTEAQRHLSKKHMTRLLATGFEALGQINKAEEHFQTLLDTEGSDPVVLREVASFFGRQGQLAKAEKTLLALVRPETGAPAAMAGWARRTLAVTLTAQGGYERFKQAEAILKPASKDEASREDRLTRAFVLASQPAHRREAIQTIETLTREAPVPDEMRFLLAQLYEADGNWQSAELHYLAVLRSQERNPGYLDRYVSGLLRQGKAEAAQVWLDKLVAAAPKALRTLELRIHVLKATAKTDEAVKLVKDYLRDKDARLDLAGAWFELLGQNAEAESAYRALAASSKQPEAILLSALHLGRQKKVAEALAICEKAWGTCRPDAVARTSVTVLRSGQWSSEQWKTVEGWIVAAVKKTPQATMLRLLLAEVYEQQGRQHDSIQLYRAILEQEAQNVVALNNLAYLIALKEGKTAEALKLMNQAIDLAGPVHELLDTRAVVYLADKQVEMAVKDLQQAIAQAPAPMRYFHLAQARHMANDRVAATVAWRKATELGLQASDVHPMERAGYEQLVNDLN